MAELTDREKRLIGSAQWIGWMARVYLENNPEEFKGMEKSDVYDACIKKAAEALMDHLVENADGAK